MVRDTIHQPTQHEEMPCDQPSRAARCCRVHRSSSPSPTPRPSRRSAASGGNGGNCRTPRRAAARPMGHLRQRARSAIFPERCVWIHHRSGRRGVRTYRRPGFPFAGACRGRSCAGARPLPHGLDPGVTGRRRATIHQHSVDTSRAGHGGTADLHRSVFATAADDGALLCIRPAVRACCCPSGPADGGACAAACRIDRAPVAIRSQISRGISGC